MDLSAALVTLLSELLDGAPDKGGAFIVNSGDVGILRSLHKLSAAEASRSVNGGATIAAHAQHLRFGFSLMNQWSREGGNPFANAKWDEAWKLSDVDTAQWEDAPSGQGPVQSTAAHDIGQLPA